MAIESEITALIKLLDDEDQEVFKHVHQKLKSLGPEVIPALEDIEISQLPPITHERLDEIIHEIQYETLVSEWQEYLKQEYLDLSTGIFLISRYYFPGIKLADIRKRLQKIKQSIWLELNPNQTPLEQVQIFNQVFYSHLEYSSVQTSKDYQDLCINHVFETKKGGAITVGIIYQIIAHELSLPAYGVNLTKHYILAFCKRAILDFSLNENLEKEVMFYINPVNKGNIFSRNEIKDYLEKLQMRQESHYFTPADNRSILRELFAYHLDICHQTNDEKSAEELSYLLQML
ncbi:MAG: transglutaminase family protein [Bacteroidetes bacterium]|nr:transglutaminase family protein [Bacteroidota bacterium]